MSMKLSTCLNERCVLFLDAADKSSALEALIEAAHKERLIGDKYEFAHAIAARELIMSTGIGIGIAVPHVTMRSIHDFFVVPGILKRPVDWESIDQNPVDLIFLIGGPDNNKNSYLAILSRIVSMAKLTDFRAELSTAKTAAQVISIIKRHEKE